MRHTSRSVRPCAALRTPHRRAAGRASRLVASSLVSLLLLLVGLPSGPAAASARELVVTTTIQAAVDAAQPGDTIRVPPGIYRENVVINKDGLQIRGSHGAVLDGVGLAGTTGIRVAPVAPATVIRGFTLSGLTVQNYRRTGVLLRSVDGFHLEGGRYRKNAVYDIFPILSTNGVIEQNDASGSDDSGIYIGQSSGVGLLNVGGDRLVAERNVMHRNQSAGIAIIRLPAALAALDPRIDPLPDENRIERNVVRGNGHQPDSKIAPLPGRDLVWDATGRGNCWLANSFETSFPSTLPTCQ